ncbi:hypothetical protein E2C01_003034 [Portunus trituberculatus]|uniref:Uncharacterized protein n=1 Tax=Portunus trituberculatus TaxID=210409 RepID=A0A5B7CNP1_PORTR|nr:hypothetical protein [Portunus trituberculatus]
MMVCETDVTREAHRDGASYEKRCGSEGRSRRGGAGTVAARLGTHSRSQIFMLARKVLHVAASVIKGSSNLRVRVEGPQPSAT